MASKNHGTCTAVSMINEAAARCTAAAVRPTSRPMYHSLDLGPDIVAD